MLHASESIFALLVVLVLVGIYVTLTPAPKRYYFVRHGRTHLNDAEIKQGAEGGLSPSGVAEAHTLGRYFKRLRIQAICASPYERAMETARIIASYVKKEVVAVPLLAERRNPSEVIGKHTDDPEVKRIRALIDTSFHGDDFRVSDEENFADLSARAERALTYLAHRRGRRICVVTHHAFLKMMLARMLIPEGLHAPDFVTLSFFNHADNGGVTICEYYPPKPFGKTHGWRIVSYNERAS